MTDWLGFTAYRTAYPTATLTEAEYSVLALQAEAIIDRRTYGRAELVDIADTGTRTTLAAIEGLLINRLVDRAAADAKSAGGTIQSATNDGYSETYTVRATVQTARQYEDSLLIMQMLNFPETRWLLYAGGVYHQFGRGNG